MCPIDFFPLRELSRNRAVSYFLLKKVGSERSVINMEGRFPHPFRPVYSPPFLKSLISEGWIEKRALNVRKLEKKETKLFICISALKNAFLEKLERF